MKLIIDKPRIFLFDAMLYRITPRAYENFLKEYAIMEEEEGDWNELKKLIYKHGKEMNEIYFGSFDEFGPKEAREILRLAQKRKQSDPAGSSQPTE